MTPPAAAWRTTLWLGWLAWAVWITAGPFRRLVEAFRNPGPEYYRLLLWTLPIFGGVVGLYLWLRRAGLWRYEPAIVAGVCAGAFLFYRFAATLLLAGLFLACYAAGAFRWILAGAFLLASAFDVKHVALFGAVPLGGMFLFAVWRQPAKAPAFAKLVLVLVLAGTYWHARAFVLTGNPLYPESISRAAPAVAGETHSNPWTGLIVRYAQTIWEAHFDGQFAFEGPLRTPLGIVLVMFLPAWILFRKKVLTGAARVLLLFAGLYFVYWIHTYPVLRYSLPATILLFVLTGARAGEWFEQGGAVMRASLLAAMAYSLTFAMLGTAIIGLNGPQLRWLARQVDDRGYLRAVFAPYRVSEFLTKAASPGDRVLGFEYLPGIYAPPSMHIDGFTMGPNRSLTAEFVKELRDGRYRWIVALRTAASDIQSAAGAIPLSQRYEDNDYVVFHADR